MLAALLSAPVQAEDLDTLYDRLRAASADDSPAIEAEIEAEWQKSGSAAMDLLLRRGQDALADGQAGAAIDHFSALIDHAPDFAEGYNARAAAFFQQGMFGQAIDDIAHVLMLDPRHYTAITGLALMFEEMDRPADAADAYRAALAINPHLAGAEENIKRLEAETAGREI
ncbi:tetratricopeptide repeat protein [Falsirhodobacter algicola]|uniref:tetratricopeptide repeat protein n=1 Tax=Falsirhodobacter algicola TaxID=2692330 RepID=UPI00201330B1|nr:hypothetical protein [Falsirhodobacter algicola]